MNHSTRSAEQVKRGIAVVLLGMTMTVFLATALTVPAAVVRAQGSSDPEVVDPNAAGAGFAYEPTFLPDIVAGAAGPGELIFNIYKYLVGLVGVVAVGTIIYAGILRTMSASQQKIQESNQFIRNAIKGIVLLFGAQVLFNTIDKNIIDVDRIDTLLKTTIPKVERTESGSWWNNLSGFASEEATSTSIYGRETPTQGQLTGNTFLCGSGEILANCNESTKRDVLAVNNVQVTQPPCTTTAQERTGKLSGVAGQGAGCISMRGVQQETLDAMAAVARAGVPVSVTSVTEGNHAEGTYSHANGYKWDMSPVAESFFAQKPEQFEKIATRSDSSATYRDKTTGAVCSLEVAAPKHWDCSVK